jgi:alkanesulfonate monooxygenase SsuD/methylene tetrahydromethanopterin reductase-like flavin-dependent oxidoreductase (luciferase family)
MARMHVASDRDARTRVTRPLEFGIMDGFGDVQAYGSAADAYDQHIRDAVDAERMGYRFYFFIEHQNAPFAYVSAPSVYLAALARETSTLRFGPMVYQLPMHHPIRLAQDAAMVDNLSHGRLEFGAGYGIHAHEFVRWKLPFGERRAMGEEMMDIVVQAWTEDSVTYEGKYWSFDEALPKPRPYQQPYPPVWIGAHSKTSFEYAARRNFNVGQNIDVDDVIAEKFDYFRSVWKTFDHAGPPPRTLIARHVHVAETDLLARAEAEPQLLKGFFGGDAAMRRIAATRIGFGGDPRMTGGERTPDIDERGRVFGELTKSYDFWIDSGLAIVGSPETVRRRLRDQQQHLGYDMFLAQHQLGEMPRAQALKSLELFGREVIPAFNTVVARR